MKMSMSGADMPKNCPMSKKVKQSGSSMDTASNTPSQGTGGGSGGGKFKTKSGAPSGPIAKEIK